MGKLHKSTRDDRPAVHPRPITYAALGTYIIDIGIGTRRHRRRVKERTGGAAERHELARTRPKKRAAARRPCRGSSPIGADASGSSQCES